MKEEHTQCKSKGAKREASLEEVERGRETQKISEWESEKADRVRNGEICEGETKALVFFLFLFCFFFSYREIGLQKNRREWASGSGPCLCFVAIDDWFTKFPSFSFLSFAIYININLIKIRDVSKQKKIYGLNMN